MYYNLLQIIGCKFHKGNEHDESYICNSTWKSIKNQ
jgi:hypothetical protein